MKSILLIEDDSFLAKELSLFLYEKMYQVEVSEEGLPALSLLQDKSYDICLLDIGLPDCSGFELCKMIRSRYNIPIIILTALDNEDEIICGLNCGADDYITKPTSLKVLQSRIEAQIRRSNINNDKVQSQIYTGELVLDMTHQMIYKNMNELVISNTEFNLCTMLVKNDSRIMPRALLLERIWDADERFIEDNTLSVHVSRLRKKLGTYEGRHYIETIKGVGYRWNIPTTGESR